MGVRVLLRTIVVGIWFLCGICLSADSVPMGEDLPLSSEARDSSDAIILTRGDLQCAIKAGGFDELHFLRITSMTTWVSGFIIPRAYLGKFVWHYTGEDDTLVRSLENYFATCEPEQKNTLAAAERILAFCKALFERHADVVEQVATLVLHVVRITVPGKLLAEGCAIRYPYSTQNWLALAQKHYPTAAPYNLYGIVHQGGRFLQEAGINVETQAWQDGLKDFVRYIFFYYPHLQDAAQEYAAHHVAFLDKALQRKRAMDMGRSFRHALVCTESMEDN